MKIHIIGCGISGITAANLLKKDGNSIEIFETRNHIGGNCHDYKLFGCQVHSYGPHIFNTNDEEVFSLLSEHTKWKDFSYRPVGNTDIGYIQLPYCKKTEEQIGRSLSDLEIREIIFRGYSEKKWGIKLENLPNSIISRVKFRSDEYNPTWFGDTKYQCLPLNGYTSMFESMLDGVTVHLDCKPKIWNRYDCDLLIYTGKIDEYYNYCYEELDYRNISFTKSISPINEAQKWFTENQNRSTSKHLRVCDYSFLHETNDPKMSIKVYEIPDESGVSCYPMNFGENTKRFMKYRNINTKTIFLGRLATYKYLDMWMAVKQTIKKLKNI
jgi:UDP-galactopyranose mutase